MPHGLYRLSIQSHGSVALKSLPSRVSSHPRSHALARRGHLTANSINCTYIIVDNDVTWKRSFVLHYSRITIFWEIIYREIASLVIARRARFLRKCKRNCNCVELNKCAQNCSIFETRYVNGCGFYSLMCMYVCEYLNLRWSLRTINKRDRRASPTIWESSHSSWLLFISASTPRANYRDYGFLRVPASWHALRKNWQTSPVHSVFRL